jgi:aspartate carbamoyltransferase catalytic subunit
MTTTVQQIPTGHAKAPGGAGGTTEPAAPERISLPRHLLSAADLNRATAEHVLSTAQRLEQAIAGREVRKLPTLRGRTVVNLFFEDSTRTRPSGSPPTSSPFPPKALRCPRVSR